jgi:hypothetical protein
VEAYSEWGAASAPDYSLDECMQRCMSFNVGLEPLNYVCQYLILTASGDASCEAPWVDNVFPYGILAPRGRCILYVELARGTGAQVSSEVQCRDGTYTHAAPVAVAVLKL